MTMIRRGRIDRFDDHNDANTAELSEVSDATDVEQHEQTECDAPGMCNIWHDVMIRSRAHSS